MFSNLVVNFAQKYMEQIGVKNFTVSYKDILLAPNSKTSLDASNQHLFIVEADSYLSITSKNGSYNQSNFKLTVQNRIHTGSVEFKNLSANAPARAQIYECTPI